MLHIIRAFGFVSGARFCARDAKPKITGYAISNK